MVSLGKVIESVDFFGWRRLEISIWSILRVLTLMTRFSYAVNIYSQSWVNDHLRITTTCLQRPLFWGPDFNFHNIKLPLNNDHKFRVPRVVVIHKFDCSLTSLVHQNLNFRINPNLSATHFLLCFFYHDVQFLNTVPI